MNTQSIASVHNACVAPVEPGIDLTFELASGSKKKKTSKTSKKKKRAPKTPDPPKVRPPNPMPNWRGKT